MIERELRERGYLIYTVRGRSMLPLLRERRDLIVVRRRPEGRCRRYDVVLYRRKSGSYVLHRVVGLRPGGYIVCGDNQRRPEEISEEQVLGVLSRFVRDGQEIPVTDCRYRLYVLLWWLCPPLRRGLQKLKRRFASPLRVVTA